MAAQQRRQLCALVVARSAGGGALQPVHINIEFDASVVDLIIDRLTMLRAQMKPPWEAGKLN